MPPRSSIRSGPANPRSIYGNVRNNGCITSLPDNCAAEVPCLVDASGIQPTFIGDLPPQLTALMRTNINVQELTVQALMTENREHIYHAAMMDPHTAAELDLDQIWTMVGRTARRPWRLAAGMGPHRPQGSGRLTISPGHGPKKSRGFCRGTFALRASPCALEEKKKEREGEEKEEGRKKRGGKKEGEKDESEAHGSLPLLIKSTSLI